MAPYGSSSTLDWNLSSIDPAHATRNAGQVSTAMQEPKPNTRWRDVGPVTIKVDRRAAIHGKMKRQHDERQRRRNEAIHPAQAFPVPQARDDRDDGRAPSHDPLREPLEQPGMHGQARGAGIAPAAAATMRAPPRHGSSLTSASRLHARGNSSEAPEKGATGEQRKLAITIKQTNSFRRLFVLPGDLAYTARDSNQEN